MGRERETSHAAARYGFLSATAAVRRAAANRAGGNSVTNPSRNDRRHVTASPPYFWVGSHAGSRSSADGVSREECQRSGSTAKLRPKLPSPALVILNVVEYRNIESSRYRRGLEPTSGQAMQFG